MLLYSLLGILLSQAFYARIAQLVVQLFCNQLIAGSSPVSGTIRLAKSEPLPILPSMGFGISHGGSSKVSRVHISLIYIIWQGYCCTSKKIWPTFECNVKTTGSSRSATYLQGRGSCYSRVPPQSLQPLLLSCEWYQHSQDFIEM